MEKQYCPHCMHLNEPGAVMCGKCQKSMTCANEAYMLPIGTKLQNRYIVGKSIGQGGAGITYIGLDQVLGIPVAIKEYYPDSIAKRNNTVSEDVLTYSDEDTTSWYAKMKSRFLEEARLLASFAGNSNLVYVSNLFEENATAYFVMEYLDGQTLNEWMKDKGTISFNQAYSMLKPIIQTIGDINQQGFIHRDISPSNIMVLKNGNVKLLDFGAARDYSNAGEKSISVVLKPGYAPQEQYNTRGKQGPWTDVYAMCATIYRLITGKVPENALNRMFEDDLALPSALGAELTAGQEAVLMQGLAVRTNERIQSMEELMHKIEAVDASAPVVEVDEEEDDERTLLTPTNTIYQRAAKRDAAEAAPKEKPFETVIPSQPKAETPSRQRSDAAVAPAQPKAETPSRQRPDAAVAPAQPKAETPSRQRPDAAAAPAQPKAKTPRKTRPAATSETEDARNRRGKKKDGKKIGLIVAILALLLVVGIVIKFTGSSVGRGYKKTTKGQWEMNTYSSGGTYAHAKEANLTAQDMERVKDCSSITMYRCTVSQEAIDYLAKHEKLTAIEFDECTGFTSLAPLAQIDTLEKIDMEGKYDQTTSLDSGSLFNCEFPSVEELALKYYTFTDGGAFLKNFPALENLYMIKNNNIKELPLPTTTLRYLTMRECPLGPEVDLSPIGRCSQLYELDMKKCGISDLSFLSENPELESIAVDGNQITTLEPLAICSVTELRVNDNKLTNLAGLENSQELKYLYAAENDITDISAIAQATKMTKLDLGNNEITDISALSEMKSVTELGLYGNQLTDCSSLGNMKEVKQLDLSRNQLTNLDGCQQMIKLEKLAAAHNQIASISGLSNCTVLDTVYLPDNQISDASVLAKSNKSLMIVYLEDNQLTDISFLQGATELESLCIHRNNISSLKGLEDSTKLKVISAHHNVLTDISALAESDALYYADLGDNNLTDISAVSQKSAEKRVLLLNNNQISDISSLRTDTTYVALALHGNPINDFSVTKDFVNQKLNADFSAGWNGDVNLARPFAYFSNGGNLYVVDAPLDQQMAVQNAFKDEHETTVGEKFTYDISFYTNEEMDAHLNEQRSKVIDENLEKQFEYTVEE